MKNFVIALGLALVVVITGFFAIQHRMDYLKKQQATQAAEQAQATSTAAKENNLRQAELSAVIAQYNGQVGECEKGAVAYSKLPLVTRKTLAAPNCGTVIK